MKKIYELRPHRVSIKSKRSYFLSVKLLEQKASNKKKKKIDPLYLVISYKDQK